MRNQFERLQLLNIPHCVMVGSTGVRRTKIIGGIDPFIVAPAKYSIELRKMYFEISQDNFRYMTLQLNVEGMNTQYNRPWYDDFLKLVEAGLYKKVVHQDYGRVYEFIERPLSVYRDELKKRLADVY